MSLKQNFVLRGTLLNWNFSALQIIPLLCFKKEVLLYSFTSCLFKFHTKCFLFYLNNFIKLINSEQNCLMPSKKTVASQKLPNMRKTKRQTQAMQVESLFPSNAEKFSTDSASSSNVKDATDNASNLFDSLFSSSSKNKTSKAEPNYVSNGVLSSSPSLGLHSSNTNKQLGNDIDVDMKPVSPMFKSNSITPVRQSFSSSCVIGKKRPSPKMQVSSSSLAPTQKDEYVDEYDFSNQHLEKKTKTDQKFDKTVLIPKVFGIGKSKMSYTHKWSDPENFEDEVKQEIKTASATAGTFGFEDEYRCSSNSYTSFRKVKQAQQCLESGELDDFKQELQYITTTLLNADAPPNLRYLSTVQLAKKCVSIEFRHFLKTQNVIDKIFLSLADSTSTPGLSLAISTVLYFLARDQKNLIINENSLRLISVLLKQDNKASDAEFKKQAQEIWLIIKDWLYNCAEKTTKNIQFDMTEATLSTSFLMLEALAYIAVREHEQFFKQELLNTGCLQWVVAKFDKAVLTLSYAPSNGSEAHAMLLLKEIERCYRILENAAAFNKRNQAYLINHRNGLLLVASAKFLSFFQKFFDDDAHCSSEFSSNSEGNSKSVYVQIFDCVCLMSRVLMNVSHENELCCLRLGQMSNFLSNCMSTLTNMAPRYAPNEKFFDLCVMMYGLLVNIVERCNANRIKVLELKTTVYNPETKDNQVYPVLEALTKLFIRHDTAARTIDEELDNDLVFEEPLDGEDSNQEAAATNNGRLQRPVELSEDEMLNAVQSAMNKASAHMEDSMIASYVALLIGCLVETNEKLASEIKNLLPDKNLEVMIDQLQRFLDFMKITNLKSEATRSIERIIKSMNVAAGIIT